MFCFIFLQSGTFNYNVKYELSRYKGSTDIQIYWLRTGFPLACLLRSALCQRHESFSRPWRKLANGVETIPINTKATKASKQNPTVNTRHFSPSPCVITGLLKFLGDKISPLPYTVRSDHYASEPYAQSLTHKMFTVCWYHANRVCCK